MLKKHQIILLLFISFLLLQCKSKNEMNKEQTSFSVEARNYYSLLGEDKFLLFDSNFYIRYTIKFARKKTNNEYVYTIRSIGNQALITGKTLFFKGDEKGSGHSLTFDSVYTERGKIIDIKEISFLKAIADSLADGKIHFTPFNGIDDGYLTQLDYNNGKKVISFSISEVGIDNMLKIDSIFFNAAVLKGLIAEIDTFTKGDVLR